MAGRTRTPRSAPKAARGAPEAAPAANHAKPGGFALDELRQLIRLVQKTGIGELEVSSGGRTVRIAALPTGVTATVAPPAHPTPAPAAAPAAPATPRESADEESRLPAVTSPMVGTFYRSPAPEADPYVEVGSQIEVGQTVCIVEAMKLMNEIESEVKGRIARILVENAQPVEYGQKLFLIEPA
jgi:acetyl-CoA carboxylase biotin carboxyl carrier protein